MPKADGGKHLETLAQQLISASANPAKTQTQSVAGDIAKMSWRTNPNPPNSAYNPEDGCVVYLTGPYSAAELNRTLCVIQRWEPSISDWVSITDTNGTGTTFAPFNGACVYDIVEESDTYSYRAYAEYSTGTPNWKASEPIEIEVENCERAVSPKAAKKSASKKA